jgi:cytochrome c-type biogenesis protein CcmF
VTSLGRVLLVVALALEAYGIGASVYGVRARRPAWVESGRRAVYALAVVLTLTFAILVAAFVRSDFSLAVVAEHSSTTTPAFYRAAAAWSAQEGSLLLWVWLLSVWSSAALFLTRGRLRDVAAWAQAVLLGFAGFFTMLLLFLADPFERLHPAPQQGVGLSPLLRHPSMMFHPPMLYSGYTLFAIPFAFAIGALIARRLDAQWIRSTRRFALAAWFFLGVGILLGARWSYAELGWGGYWAWDPVENASLLPWLTGTAFLHSVMVQEKRGMLKIWNASLIAATFVLSLLGTFLVRSGVLDSIHAFGASTLGTPFLIFIGLVALGSVVLIVSRHESLRSEAKLDSLWSREAFFLLNNLVLVALCVVIAWGTYFPLISEAFTGTKQSVGPPFFSKVTTPIALLLVLLTGVGPMLAWRRGTAGKAGRVFALPTAVAALTLVAMLALTSASESSPSLIMFTFVAFVLAAVGQEFWRGARARRVVAGESLPVALVQLVSRNRRRYGGYTVHAGLALLLLGVAASSAFVDQRDVRLSPGQSADVGGYRITYVKPTAALLDDKAGTGAPVTLGAELDVRKGDKRWTFHPARNYYPASDGSGGSIGRYFDGEANSEVDTRWGAFSNFWTAVEPDINRLEKPIDVANKRFPNATPEQQAIILAALAANYRDNAPPATFRAIHSPMIMWIWIGGLVVIMGSITALWPSPDARRRRAASLAAARLGRELSRA